MHREGGERYSVHTVRTSPLHMILEIVNRKLLTHQAWGSWTPLTKKEDPHSPDPVHIDPLLVLHGLSLRLGQTLGGGTPVGSTAGSTGSTGSRSGGGGGRGGATGRHFHPGRSCGRSDGGCGRGEGGAAVKHGRRRDAPGSQGRSWSRNNVVRVCFYGLLEVGPFGIGIWRGNCHQ